MNSIPNEKLVLSAAIEAIEAQRSVLGDAAVQMVIDPMRAKLAALEQAGNETLKSVEQLIKQTTVLFLDVVGSTSMSQRFDPEELSAIMDTALARFTTVIENRGGRTLKYLGDGLMAAFGVDQVQEDDAERCVLAGLDLLAEVKRYAAELKHRYGIASFNIRIGMHSSTVLMGGGVDADSNIRGMGVNVAARMEQAAPAGGLRITANTYALVRGRFDVIAQDPISVKGVDTPVLSYLVVRSKTRAFHNAARGIEGVSTKMIGRDAQFQLLQGAFQRLHAVRKLSVVTIVADAGIGKSRLLHEFTTWAQIQPEICHMLHGRAIPPTQGQPFGLLRDMLARYFQIADDDTVPVARAKLERAIIPLFSTHDHAEEALAHAHVLGHLIGIEYLDSRHVKSILDDPKQIRNRGMHTAAEFFRLTCAMLGTPIVLQLEDLHWADNESLEFLKYMYEVNSDVPMLILGLSRPTLFERRDEWSKSEGKNQRVDLCALDGDLSVLLVREMLKKIPEVPPVLMETITNGAEGNPFYMEELIKMLIDQGSISAQADNWLVDEARLLATSVPATLTGVLQARIDSLPATERLTLQEASVIGLVFWDQALHALDPESPSALARLVQRDLTLPRLDSASHGLREYAFKHAMLHQVTYSTVLRRRRMTLHGKLAQWLANFPGARANDFLGQAADHFEYAGDLTNSVHYHVRAAEYAGVRFAHERVLHHTTRALIHLDELEKSKLPSLYSAGSAVRQVSTSQLGDAVRWRLLKNREITLDIQGTRTEQRLDLERMSQLAELLHSDEQRCYVAWRQTYFELRVGNFGRAQMLGLQGISLAKDMGNGRLRLQCQRLLALALAYQGNWHEGQVVAQDALANADAVGDALLKYYIVNALGVITSSIKGDPVEGLVLIQQSMCIAREIGNPHEEAVALVNLGDCLMKLGDLHSARDHFNQANRKLHGIGDQAMLCTVFINLAQIAMMQTDKVSAVSLAQQALEIAIAIERRSSQISALILLGDAQVAFGSYPTAKEAYEQSLKYALDMNSEKSHKARASLAQLALLEGDLPTASRHVQPMVDIVEAGGIIGGVDFPREIEFICYRVLLTAGDPRANAWLTRSHATLQAMAARIPEDGMRHRFLRQIPSHSQIVDAYQFCINTALPVE